MEATRRRILDAAVVLHAEKGGTATSYAEIAARADVSVPTVYKHFPDRAALFRGCTGHAAAGAPPIDAQAILEVADRSRRLRALAQTLYRRHAYFEPWLRHREEHHDADLAAALAPARAATRDLIRAALADGGVPLPEGALGLAEALLDYPAWETLVRHHGLSDARAIELVCVAIEALFHPPLAGAPR